MNSIIRKFIALTLLTLCTDSFSQERLPYAVQKLIKDYEAYEKDITEKASELIKKKRLATIKTLELESAKLTKTGNDALARAVLELASAMTEGKELSVSESNEASGNSRWNSLFKPESLPDTWIIPEDPDGGRDYVGGVLLMKSVFEDSVALHEAPEGDLVVRLRLKIEDNDNKDTKDERKTASVGFINSKESLVLVSVNPSGTVSGYTNITPETDLGNEKSGLREGKFTEVQIAWVATYFLVFVKDKLLIKSDVGIPRGTAKISLLADNSNASFSDVEYLKPTLDDLKKMAAGKPLD
ncbi:MAG TPA: hypothetical protein EYG40_04325 [Verrucomicrobia bacterium]|nr:hypothetical protein [Verrucomicrobiales bacterium]HIL54244.1 hypothetical protein [Verrucomicrobiota bacterium]